MEMAQEVPRTTRENVEAMLLAAGFKPAPGAIFGERGGEVHVSTPDGLYFNHAYAAKGLKPLDVQVIVVGPVRLSPVEIAEKLDDYWVHSLEVLPSDAENVYAAQVIRERGFISIILRNWQDEPRPSAR